MDSQIIDKVIEKAKIEVVKAKSKALDILETTSECKSGIFLKRMLFYSIGFISLYTIACMAFMIIFDFKPDTTLTACVFAFFGTEIALLMVKKILDNFENKKIINKVIDNKEEK